MFRLPLLCLILLSGILLFPQVTNAETAASPPAPAAAFTPNGGQIFDDEGNSREDVLFKSAAGGVEMYLRKTGFSYVFTAYETGPRLRDPLDATFSVREDDQRMATRYRMDLELAGANPAADVETSLATAGHENFYRGRDLEVLNLSSYREVLYREIYPKIDLRVYFTNTGLKYDFFVWPGGNPADIRLKYIGATGFRLGADGSMLVSNPHGHVQEDKPYTYQSSVNHTSTAELREVPQREVTSGFRVYGEEIGFELGHYDPKQLLVIDPGVVWGTYYGGAGGDSFEDIYAHDDGSLIAVGYTSSFDFPTTPGLDKQTSLAGSRDAMVVKFGADRQRLWATYWGGSLLDQANGVYVNSIGSVHLVGSTGSSNFPIKNGFQTELINDIQAAFVSQLSPDEGILRWSSYFGGGNRDEGVDIAGYMTQFNETILVICGTTAEVGALFPIKNAEKSSKNDGLDMFLARIKNDGSPLWSTYVGGTAADAATGVTIDSEQNVTLVGWTRSDDVQKTENGFQPASAGGVDGLVAKFTANTGRTLWVSYLGTEGRDLAMDVVALPNNDNLMILGETHHTSFPVKGGWQTTHNNVDESPSNAEVFLFEVSKSSEHLWSTLHGGDSIDRAYKIAAYDDGSFMFTGHTNSCIYPQTENPFRELADLVWWEGTATVGQVNAARELTFSQLLFLDKVDQAFTCAATGPSAEDGNMIIAGSYQSDAMPTTDDAFQDFVKGSEEGYIWEFGCDAFTEIAADGPLEFCEGGSVELDAGDGFIEYLWSTGAKTQTIEVDAGGDFWVKVIDDTDCEFTTPPTAVSVFPLPDPVISADGPTELCNGESVTLDAGAGYESYKWSNGSETQTITVSETDEYFVVVTGEGDCEAETSIQVNVRPIPVVTAEPASLDWGILDGCQSSVNLPLTLTNTNGFPVRLTDLEFSNAAEFAASNFAADMQLEPDEAVTLNIVFTPATLDPVNAELRIKIAPCDVELVIPLTGSKGELLLTASPSTIEFEDVFLCANAPKEQEVEFVNSGAEDVILETSQSNAPFSIVDQNRLPLTIAPGETETLRLRFAPVAAGPASSEISVNYRSGSCNDNIRIVVSGRGRDADLALLNTAGLQFPRVGDCDESADAELLLNILGGADGPLQILTIEDVSGQVTSPSGLPLELAVADLVRLPLRLTPNAEGVVSGSATITYELDGCSKTLDFDYSGEKRGISISLPESIDFGAYYSCADVALTQRVQLEVSGAEAFVDEVIIEGDFASNIQRQAPAPEFFDITFVTDDPEATGSMTIRFSPCGIERVIQLSGRRIDLEMTGPETEDFETVQLGDAQTRTITWTNDGNGPISIAQIDCLADPFTLVSPGTFPIELQVGESIAVVVEFDPQIAGIVAGELCLRTVDPCELTFRTVLTGTGIDDVVLPAELEVYIPDLVANPHWASFDIPILVRGLEGFDGDFNVEALAYLRMNSSVFFPRAVSGGAIDANVSNLGERSLLLRSGPVTLAEDGPLAVLSGAPLLGDAVTSEIVIDSVVFIGRDVNATLTGGSLRLDSLCEVDGTRLLTTAPRFGIIGLTPNPSNQPPEFQVRGIAGASLQMQIRATTGRTVFERKWPNAGANLMTVRPDIELAPGVYQVLLNAEFRSDAKLFVIVR